jgi:uncharacterized protein YdgA (DUF945 family)
MKKIVLIVIAVLAAIMIFLPKYIGMQFASGLQDTVDTLNQKTMYEISVDELNSQWTSTTAILDIKLKMPDVADQGADLSVKVDLNASHGPFLGSGDASIGLLHTVINSQDAELPRDLVLEDASAPIFNIDAHTGLFGATHYTMNLAGLSYTDINTGMTFSFSGLLGKGTSSSNGYTFTGNSLEMKIFMGDEEVVAFEDLNMDSTSDVGIAQMMSMGLYNSESTVSIADVTINSLVDDTQTSVRDTTMLITTSLDEATQLGDMSFKTTMTEFAAPSMNITDLIVVFDVNNLQAKFMRAYQEFTAKSMEYMADPVAMQTATQAFLDEHLLEQLQQNPEYNLSELRGKVNGSEFNGHVFMKLTDVLQLPATLEDPNFWVENGEMDTLMRMEKAAAEFFTAEFIKTQLAGNPQFLSMSEEEQTTLIAQQTQATLAALVEQGMLQTEGADYRFTFTLKDTQAELNGQPMPLPF